MPGKQAKVVTPPMLKRMLRRVSHSSFPARDRAMILLSIKAGLRPAKSRVSIGRWCSTRRAACPARSTSATSSRRSAGDGGYPCIPICGARWNDWRARAEPVGPVIRSYRGSHLKANSIVNWFVALFKELGYEGCSSHSGRRSFITMAARNVHRSGCSLRDVQLLAGHRSIETTERYIDGDTCAQRRLVAYV